MKPAFTLGVDRGESLLLLACSPFWAQSYLLPYQVNALFFSSHPTVFVQIYVWSNNWTWVRFVKVPKGRKGQSQETQSLWQNTYLWAHVSGDPNCHKPSLNYTWLLYLQPFEAWGRYNISDKDGILVKIMLTVLRVGSSHMAVSYGGRAGGGSGEAVGAKGGSLMLLLVSQFATPPPWVSFQRRKCAQPWNNCSELLTAGHNYWSDFWQLDTGREISDKVATQIAPPGGQI